MGKKISDIIVRLKKLYGFKSDAAVATALSLPKATLSDLRKSGAIPYEALLEFSRKEKLSLDWLLTGEEPFMLFNYWTGTDRDGERLYATNKGYMPQSEIENLLGISAGTLEDWFSKQIAVIKLPECVESAYATERSRLTLKKIIIALEEYLIDEGFILDPGKKAEIVAMVYEDILNNKSREEDLFDNIARLANLASSAS